MVAGAPGRYVQTHKSCHGGPLPGGLAIALGFGLRPAGRSLGEPRMRFRAWAGCGLRLQPAARRAPPTAAISRV
jgi:hypothetical protein